MKHPEFTCSACGSPNLRRSHIQSLAELPKMAMGVYPFRCLECKARFSINIWLFSKKTTAVCPRCLAIEVAPATLEGMRLSLLERLQVTFGARGYRCFTCGRRFLSFKRAEQFLPAPTPSEPHVVQREADTFSAVSGAK